MELLACLFLLALSGQTRGENGELAPNMFVANIIHFTPCSAVLVSSTRAVEVLTSLGQSYLCSLPDLPDGRGFKNTQVNYQRGK